VCGYTVKLEGITHASLCALGMSLSYVHNIPGLLKLENALQWKWM